MRLDRRGVLLVLVVLAAVAAVGLAARGDQGDTGEPALTLAPGTGRAASSLVGWLLLLLCLAVLVLVALSLGPSGQRRTARKPMRSRLGTLIAVLAAIALASNLQRPDEGVLDDEAPVAEDDAVDATGEPADGDGRSPAGTLAVAGVAALVLAAGTAIVVRSRLRRDGAVVVDEEVPVLVTSGAGGPSLAEQAAAEPDPRRAVLLAFAAAEHAIGRPPATSPREWLRTAPPDVAGPLAELVGRYEIARFSHHAVDADDRRAALDALGRLP